MLESLALKVRFLLSFNLSVLKGRCSTREALSGVRGDTCFLQMHKFAGNNRIICFWLHSRVVKKLAKNRTGFHTSTELYWETNGYTCVYTRARTCVFA